MGVQDGSIRVLHVDDDPALADVVAEFLEREDDRITVTTAPDAGEGRQLLRTTPFDCVVSDYDMPGTNGIEFLEAVRDEHGDLPFILFTGKGSESVASDAISAGVTDYLQKGGSTERYEILANRIANVVEGHRSRRALERSQRRLSLFVEQSPLGVVEYEPDFEIVGWNPQAEEIFGYEAGEAVGRDAGFLVPEEERDRVASVWQRVLREGESANVNRNLTADGEVITCEWHNRAVTDGDGEVLAVFSLVRDVTDRERRKRRLETLIDNLPGMVYRCANEPSWPMEFVGGECERLTGYTARELERGDVLWGEEVLHPDDRERAWNEVQSSVAAGEPFELTYRITTRDGEETVVWERGRGINGPDGDLRALEGFITDLGGPTGPDRVVGCLREATGAFVGAETPEAVAETVVDTARDVLGVPVARCWLSDGPAGGLVPVATAGADDPPGGPLTVDEGSLPRRAFETGEATVSEEFSGGDGGPGAGLRSVLAVPLGDHGVVAVGSTAPAAFEDTDRSLLRILAASAAVALDGIEREARLREERAFVEGALNAIEDAFYVLDPDGGLLRWNDRVREVTGYTDDEIAGMAPTEFFDDEGADRVAAAIAEAVETGSATVEADIVTGDGERISHEFTGSRLTGPDGELLGVAGVGRDVSERDRRERALRERNERLETFASVVSHDLRNPLEVARGQLEFARRECDSDHLDGLADTHDRLETLVEDLLALARTGDPAVDLAPVSLAAVVEDAWSTVETAGGTLRVETDRRILADRSRLRRLVENLLRNSVEHGATGRSAPDPGEATDHAVTVTVGDHPDGFYLADDGPGIPPEDRERVFERGYSTAEEGTGLGLAIVAGIADAHGWEVTVGEGAEGGVRFEVTGVEFA